MALALRLTALSYVVAHANARWFHTDPDSGDRTPVTPTAKPTTLSSEQLWAPKITAPPDEQPIDWDLRRRDDGADTICGYEVGAGNPLSSPVTCGSGEICGLDRRLGIVGCCTGTNPRGCVVPTTCLESSQSTQWTGDALTTYCGDPARPHCVTHSYEANFYDPLYGAYFIGCAAQFATGDIVASPITESNPGTTGSLSASASASGRVTTSATGYLGNNTSPTTGPSGSGGSFASMHAGEIAGGVVGGVAGLALIAAAIFFCLRRRKKQSQNSNTFTLPPALGRKMPPNDHDMYQNEAIPGSQYPSTFYGETPPGMAQMSDQPMTGYPPNAYAIPNPTYIIGNDNNRNVEAPVYVPPRVAPSKAHDETVSPIDDSPVSPVSPADHYNTMVSALSNQTPPLQPLQPAVHRPQPTYAQYSPPPPVQYQSYRPYPGT
ncbi:hypothetical protein F4861DRAFT_540511 [Xylaria intraflava]|nr:hypothetical protein F4861DRAFT_540511 [Xylaria intraflava]